MTHRVFVIADLHLGHHKAALARGFDNVFAHDNAIVEAWNSVVGKRDTVYVLGDVFRTDRLHEMRGLKKLAMGNHDQKNAATYLQWFTSVRAYFEFDGCLLSHIPVHPRQIGEGHRWRRNIHGHTHSVIVGDPAFVSVSVEQCPGMAPRPLREVIEDDAKRVVVPHAIDGTVHVSSPGGLHTMCGRLFAPNVIRVRSAIRATCRACRAVFGAAQEAVGDE